MWQFRTSVFNKVVRWRRLGEVENAYVAYNFSHFYIYLPKLIKIGGNLTKFQQNKNAQFFFWDMVYTGTYRNT